MKRDEMKLHYQTSQNKNTNYVSVNSLNQTPKYNGIGIFPPSAATVQAKLANENPEHIELIQKQANNTCLPDNLKTGMENLSGFDMGDVKVHYNSSKPAQLQALAYTQGTDIHLAPGQEKHLPHEAWHVVQQKQGRVQPSFQMKGMDMGVNDDPELEREADVMGGRANNEYKPPIASDAQLTTGRGIGNSSIKRVVQQKISTDKLNVAADNHDLDETGKRDEDRRFCEEKSTGKYWREFEFEKLDKRKGDNPAYRLGRSLFLSKGYAENLVERFDYIMGEKLQDFHLKLLVDCFIYMKNDLARAKEEDKERIFNDFSEQFASSYSAFSNIFVNKYQTGKLLLKTDAGAIKEQLEKLVDLAKKVINPFYTEFKDWEDKRSIYMHDSANLTFQTKGVWKIGDEHVKIIKTKISPGDIKYNLVELEEYNKEFSEWKSKK